MLLLDGLSYLIVRFYIPPTTSAYRWSMEKWKSISSAVKRMAAPNRCVLVFWTGSEFRREKIGQLCVQLLTMSLHFLTRLISSMSNKLLVSRQSAQLLELLFLHLSQKQSYRRFRIFLLTLSLPYYDHFAENCLNGSTKAA